jgi:hypothetical protein
MDGLDSCKSGRSFVLLDGIETLKWEPNCMLWTILTAGQEEVTVAGLERTLFILILKPLIRFVSRPVPEIDVKW